MDDDEKKIRRLLSLLLDTGAGVFDKDAFLKKLEKVEPFSSNMELAEDILEKRN